MKKVKIIDLHFILITFLIGCFNVSTKDISCILFKEDEQQKIVEKTKSKSLKNKNKYYVDIFSS